MDGNRPDRRPRQPHGRQQLYGEADVSDAAGNPASQASHGLAVDEGAPSIAIDTIASDDVLNAQEAQSDLSISGTTTGVEDGQHVTVSLNGQNYDAVVNSGAWTATVPTAALASLTDGSNYTVTADVSDAAGNPASQASHGLAVDEGAPSIAIDTIASDDVLNAQEAQSDLSISGTTTGVEDGQHVTVSLNGQNYDAVVNSGAWTATVPTAALASLTDGSNYTVTADVSDAAGNPASQASHGLAVDEGAPSIAIDTIASDDVLNAQEAQSDLSISGTTTGVENGQHVTVSLNGQNYDAVVNSGAWTATVPTAALASLTDGSNYTVTADVSDAAGNPASQASHGLAVDEGAPSIAIDTIASDDVLNAQEAQSDLSISGTTTGVENGQHVTVSLNGQNYDAVVNSGAWTATVPTAALASLTDGSNYTVTADVSDAAGNPASQASHGLAVDEGAPSIAIDTIASDDVLNAQEAQSDLSISGTTTGVENGQHVTVSLNGQNYDAVVNSGAWTATVPTAALASLTDGSNYTVTADVSDAAGNPASQASHGLAVDEGAPSIAIDTIASDDVLNAQEAQSDLSISGTTTGVENGQHVTVSLNGQNYDAVVNSGAWTATVPTAALASLTDGSNYTVTADVSDAAGNPASQASHGLAVDEGAPSIAIDTIASDDVLNAQEAQSDLSISGTTTGVENGQHVTVSLNGQTYDAVVNSGAWTATVPTAALASLTDGSNYTVTADVSDAAGNPASQASHGLAVDEGAPVTLTIVTPNGYDMHGLYGDIANSNVDTGTADATHFDAINNIGSGHTFHVVGTGLTYDGSGNLIGGTITEIDIKDTTSGDTLVTMTGFAIDAVALAAAAEAFSSSSNAAQLSAIFNQYAYTVIGGDGNDVIPGFANADTFNGGAGFNTVDYMHYGAAITVDLADPTQNSGNAKGDTYTNITNVIGTNYDDTLIGDGNVNVVGRRRRRRYADWQRRSAGLCVIQPRRDRCDRLPR